MRTITQISILQQYAISKKGLLLSGEYKNNYTKLLWQCENGHQWKTTWNHIKGGSWCPYCAKVSKPTIKELSFFANNKNGLLLSTEYKNNRTKLTWQCENGHQWESKWNDIKDGHWCPECAGHNKPNIIELHGFAKNKNGMLLSTEYKNNRTKLLWQCEDGHQWKATWDHIKGGSWCPYCAGFNKPLITELQQFAINKRGLLISDKYINCETSMIWQCDHGHQWKATWSSIKNGNTWCPECSTFKTEYKCKQLLEQKLGIAFKKTRIYYDATNKHKFYEFDGYNKDHRIAFEYHGKQHYIFPNHWHKTEKIYLEAKQRDLEKEQYCLNNNIKLLIIPYTTEKVLEHYITYLIGV